MLEIRSVTAIIRPDRLEKVEESLRKLGVPGVTVVQVKGYGEYANFYQADWMLPHVRMELFIELDRVEAVVDAIMESAHTGVEGDGFVAVTPVDAIYNIRKKKQCDEIVC